MDLNLDCRKSTFQLWRSWHAKPGGYNLARAQSLHRGSFSIIGWNGKKLFLHTSSTTRAYEYQLLHKLVELVVFYCGFRVMIGSNRNPTYKLLRGF